MTKLFLFLLLISPMASAVEIVGTWQDDKGVLFGNSGRDLCFFKEDNTFECTNYPQIGSLVLPFSGRWNLTPKKLLLHVDGSETIQVNILQFNQNEFRGNVLSGEIVSFERIKP